MNLIARIVLGGALTVMSLTAAMIPSPAEALSAASPATATESMSQPEPSPGSRMLEGRFRVHGETETWTPGPRGSSTAHLNASSGVSQEVIVRLPMPGDTGVIQIMSGPHEGWCVATPPRVERTGQPYIYPCQDPTAPRIHITDDGRIQTQGLYGLTQGDRWSEGALDQANWIDPAEYSEVIVGAGTVPVSVEKPADHEAVSSPKPVFSGFGEPGAYVTVNDERGENHCSAAVSNAGTWSCTAARAVGPGPHVAHVAQVLWSEHYYTYEATRFVVAEDESVPVSAPLMFVAVGILAATAALTWSLTWRHRHVSE